MNINEIPRRVQLDKLTPAERAIHEAILEVEKLGAHVYLTKTVILLSQAQSLLADIIDQELLINNNITSNETQNNTVQ